MRKKIIAAVILAVLWSAGTVIAASVVSTFATNGIIYGTVDTAGNINLYNQTNLRLYNSVDNPSNPVNAEWLNITYRSTATGATFDNGGWMLSPQSSGTGQKRSIALGDDNAFYTIKQNYNTNIGGYLTHLGIDVQTAFDKGGYVSYYDGILLHGAGIWDTRGSGTYSGASTLQGSVCATTPSPYSDSYQVTGCFSVDVTLHVRTAGSASLNETVSFTDDMGVAQVFTIPMHDSSGTDHGGTPITSAGWYYGHALVCATDYGGTAIVVSQTGTSPTLHDGRAVVSQMQSGRNP